MKRFLIALCLGLLAACSGPPPSETPPPVATSTSSPTPDAESPLQEVLKEMEFSRPPGTMALPEWYRKEADGHSFVTISRTDKTVIAAAGYEPRVPNRRLISTPDGEKLWLSFYCNVNEPTTSLDKTAIKAKIEQVLSTVAGQREKFQKDPQPRMTLRGNRLADLADYPGCHITLKP